MEQSSRFETKTFFGQLYRDTVPCVIKKSTHTRARNENN